MKKSFVFIAFGLGITPFRSMIVDLMDKGEHVDVLLIYQASESEDFLFREVFDEAEGKIGLRTVYSADEADKGEGFMPFLQHVEPEFKTKQFFLAGPQGAVEKCRDMLWEAGVGFDTIKTDLFTGYDGS